VTRERLLELLRQVAAGAVPPAAAADKLALAPFEQLPFATVDHHRAIRQGYPEVIYGAGKSAEQIVAIAERLAEQGDGFLVTRVEKESQSALIRRFPSAVANPSARTVLLVGSASRQQLPGRALIITAGTSDLPVAEEAAVTLEALGCEAHRLTDVGVAGIHRLLAQGDALQAASVIVVVAGMDGALPSVVGGLVSCPVIAVPTSVGYGASFGGIAPLLTMLNSCAAGVVVVNIDNGFGAGVAAARILRGPEH
jgi:pyridinium-3,5-biscarboxylic acid mononucleotide synthase